MLSFVSYLRRNSLSFSHSARINRSWLCLYAGCHSAFTHLRLIAKCWWVISAWKWKRMIWAVSPMPALSNCKQKLAILSFFIRDTGWWTLGVFWTRRRVESKFQWPLTLSYHKNLLDQPSSESSTVSNALRSFIQENNAFRGLRTSSYFGYPGRNMNKDQHNG